MMCEGDSKELRNLLFICKGYPNILSLFNCVKGKSSYKHSAPVS